MTGIKGIINVTIILLLAIFIFRGLSDDLFLKFMGVQ